jgi:glycosyltransferase involved in cell wall biosynthesis
MPEPLRISVVTPTLGRPEHVSAMLENLAQQSLRPAEAIVVDGAPRGEDATEEAVAELRPRMPFGCVYIRRGGGTAVQRNAGIDAASGDYVAFIDDDIRLEPDFFEVMTGIFAADRERSVGGVAGYITNQYLNPATSARWRWYRRLRLFRCYEPGRYDFSTGYPINRYLQAPHEGVKELDFMGAGCALWRREVFDVGLRFSEFFSDYGVLEDAHFALRARRRWRLLEAGRARCVHLRCTSGKPDSRRLARKTAVNYRYVFVDIVRDRTWRQEFRFWLVQFFDLFRLAAHALRSRSWDSVRGVLGKAEGIVAATRVRPASHAT